MAYKPNSESIKDVINRINSPCSTGGDIILPALQREFVWKPKDIARLFDSLMRDYPINSMLFWEIKNLTHSAIQFYKFLSPDYIKGTLNLSIQIPNTPQKFDVVIDGQQRLTSLYIALKGSYQTDTKNAKPQKLYLRLDKPNTSPESDMEFDFQFLTDRQYNSRKKIGEKWLRVSEVLDPNFKRSIWLRNNGLLNEDYALDTLDKLAAVLIDSSIINYYRIDNNNLDAVLDIFIRTNSGGYVLTKGALLLSTMSSEWAMKHNGINARDYVEDVIEDVKNMGYKIDKDWVLKCCGILVNAPASVNISAFSSGTTCDDIFSNKDNIRSSVCKAFQLIQDFGLVDKGLPTKLAIIPLVYFIFKNNLWSIPIQNSNTQQQSWQNMRMFLFRAIVKNLFEASTDTVLDKIRNTINSTKGKTFPYSDIETVFPNLKITNADYDDILSTRKKDAFAILNIIYALNGVKQNPLQRYDVDHIHPIKNFDSSNLNRINFTTLKDEKLAKDCKTHDTIVNLQLLESSYNKSKNATDLKTWYSNMNMSDQALWMRNNFIPSRVSLELSDFGTFVYKRESELKKILKLL